MANQNSKDDLELAGSLDSLAVRQARADPLRIALSTSSLIRPLTGIGQYTLHVARALNAEADLDMQYFYGYEWSDRAEPREIPHLAILKKWFKRLLPKPYEVSRAIQQSRFNTGVHARRPQLYHEPNFLPFNFDGPTVLTVHDLSYLRYPETHPDLRVRIMSKLLPPAIEKASHLLADSEFTRQEVMREFSVAADRISTTLLGVSAQFVPRDQRSCEAVLQRHGLRYGGFVLTVGTLEPRKNLLQVIRAYVGLPPRLARQYPLVIVGGKGWKSEGTDSELNALLADGRARHLGYLPAAELPIIYSAARIFVYPSLYEGFGLPAAEAMASGVPVIVSDRASLPEVVGDAGITVAPDDIDGMREALLELSEDDVERRRRATMGIEQAGNFSWARCGRQTAAVYRRVLGRV
jgi:glycosyltransferase involved in cell wall biosynthesis